MKLDKALTYGPTRDGGLSFMIVRRDNLGKNERVTQSIHLPKDQVEDLIEALFFGDIKGTFYGN